METHEAHESRRTVGWIVTVVFVSLLLSSALYTWGVSTGRVQFDPDSYELPGETLSWFAFCSLVFGGLLYMVASGTRAMSAELAIPALPLVGLAAVGYAAARFYEYDDYRLPQLVHRSAVSDLPGWSLGLLVVGAVVAALVAWRWRRPGLLVQGLFLWVVAAWVFMIGPFY